MSGAEYKVVKFSPFLVLYIILTFILVDSLVDAVSVVLIITYSILCLVILGLTGTIFIHPIGFICMIA